MYKRQINSSLSFDVCNKFTYLICRNELRLKNAKKNKAYVICFSLASFINVAGFFHQLYYIPRPFSSCCSFTHPFVSSRERHTPRLRRVLSAPCGASNSGTDFSRWLPSLYSVSPGRSESYRCRLLFSTLRPRGCRCRLTRP